VTLFEGRTGIMILLSDIDRYRQGKLSLNGIPVQHLVQHTHMQQGHWHAVLHALHVNTTQMSPPEYIRKILLPALESTYHSPRDHATLHALRTISLSELDWLPLNVTFFPSLLLALGKRATIWSPSDDGWCHATNSCTNLVAWAIRLPLCFCFCVVFIVFQAKLDLCFFLFVKD
jgi:hypothetical protein